MPDLNHKQIRRERKIAAQIFAAAFIMPASLFRVQLDDHVLLYLVVEVILDGESCYGCRKVILVNGEPCGNKSAVGGLNDLLELGALFGVLSESDDVAYLYSVRRDVYS